MSATGKTFGAVTTKPRPSRAQRKLRFTRRSIGGAVEIETAPTSAASDSIVSLRTDVGALRAHTPLLDDDARRLDRLERRLEENVARVGKANGEVREISAAKAKREIKSYFDRRDDKNIYPDEVVEALQLDLLLVVKLCEKLTNEGQLARTES